MLASPCHRSHPANNEPLINQPLIHDNCTYTIPMGTVTTTLCMVYTCYISVLCVFHFHNGHLYILKVDWLMSMLFHQVLYGL